VVGPLAVITGNGGLLLMVMFVGTEDVLQLNADETETVKDPLEETSILWVVAPFDQR
jgi:hypothetical protein